MSSKLVVDSKVGISCPDIGIVFDCIVKEAGLRTATVVRDGIDTLPVFDSGTILRLTASKKVLWGVVARSSRKSLEITDIDDWDQKNRREFFRLSLLDAVNISYEDEEENKQSLKGKLLDISATGLRFSCLHDFEVGDLVQVVWQSSKTFNFTCQVVRVTTDFSKRFYGCKFVDMRDKEQDDLMQEIFRIQRQQCGRTR